MTSFSQETDSKVQHNTISEFNRAFMTSDLTAGIDEQEGAFLFLGESLFYSLDSDSPNINYT